MSKPSAARQSGVKPSIAGQPVVKPSATCQFKTLFKKDMRQEFRSKTALASMALYALLVLVIYGASLGQSASESELLHVSSGLLWTQIVLASLLGLNCSFAYEKENACLEGMLLATLDRSLVFLSKALSNFIFLLIVELVSVPLFSFFFLSGAAVSESATLALLPLLAGTIGIAGAGTLLSTISVQTHASNLVLALLFVPLAFPLLYACAQATSAAFVGASGFMDIFISGVVLACAWDIVMILASWVLYDFVLET